MTPFSEELSKGVNDEENRVIRIEITTENWEDNKILAKSIGINIDNPKYVECVIDLKKKNLKVVEKRPFYFGG